jgi:predicted GNAT family N-acyltransferase
VQIVRLGHHHLRDQFECEEPSLLHYLQQQVGQDIRKKLVTCFVTANETEQVLGYYTLSSESLGRDVIPNQYIKQLPAHYNAPVILLGRLARDMRMKGQRLGEHLLLDALFRSYRISESSIGAMAVVTDPINEKAKQFYEHFGFEQLPDSGRLFLPMKVIGKLL